jgi:hypothetical protein
MVSSLRKSVVKKMFQSVNPRESEDVLSVEDRQSFSFKLPVDCEYGQQIRDRQGVGLRIRAFIVSRV